MRSQYMTGAKRIVAVGPSSERGLRADDRPAGVAHAVARLIRTEDGVAICGTEVIPLPHRDWSEPTTGVLRCRECTQLTA